MKAINKFSFSRIIKFVMVITSVFFISQKGISQLKEEWVSRYNSFDGEDRAAAMVLDNEGNAIVTGYATAKDGIKNIATVKYTQTGKELWATVFEGQKNADGSDAEANSIAADQNGNIIVAGYVHGGMHGKDFIIIKYNSNGEKIWERYFAGDGSAEDSDDEAIALVTDSKGSVIVTGLSNSRGTGYDFCTVKYTGDGQLLWVKYFDGQAGQDDYVKGIKTDQKGNIIISGTSRGIISNQDFCTVKYDAEGNELWNANYNGLGGNLTVNEDEVSALEADASGSIYVTGYSYGAGTDKDFLTIKYDSEGNVIWTSRINNENIQKGPAFIDESKAIALDKDLNVYLTGVTVSPSGNSDYFTVKLNSRGQISWARNFNSGDFGFSQDEAADIAVDIKGNVYVTGSVMKLGFERSCGSNMNFATIKYTSEGNFKWVKEFNGSERFENSDDIAKAISLDGKGGLFVMGESMGNGVDMDFCLIKYSEFATKEESAENKTEIRLNDNYPNPFNPVTKISFIMPVSEYVRLAIYDITGREIELLESSYLQSGSHNYDWNASKYSSGTYYYRIQSESFEQTKKMMLIK